MGITCHCIHISYCGSSTRREMESRLSFIPHFYRIVSSGKKTHNHKSTLLFLCLSLIFEINFYIMKYSISLTLLFSTSFKPKAKLGRILIFIILFLIFFIISFLFSLIPRTLYQHISNRVSFLLGSSTGAWLVCAIGIDLFTKTGLLDGVTLLTSAHGIFKDGPPEQEDMDRMENGVNVVRWNEGRCKGLLAGMWLL